MRVKQRVAILLSKPWRGGMLRAACSLTALIADHDWPGVGGLDVVVGLRHDGVYNWDKIDSAFTQAGARQVRRLRWYARSTRDVVRIFGIDEPTFPVETVAVPRDGRLDFLDCHAWIVFANSFEGITVPARPIAIYCADLIQRYVPALFGEGTNAASNCVRQDETFLGWRMARCVFSTTPPTLTDVIEYPGIDPARALLVPTLVESPATVASSVAGLDRTILWVTNPSPHKNHQAAIQTLARYYERGGTLDVVVCGPDTLWLNPRSGGRHPAALVLADMPQVLANTRFAGEVSDLEYLGMIEGAGVVWHNVITDNGTFVAFDAARAGRIFVSSDYPQIRYLCGRYGSRCIVSSTDRLGRGSAGAS